MLGHRVGSSQILTLHGPKHPKENSAGDTSSLSTRGPSSHKRRLMLTPVHLLRRAPLPNCLSTQFFGVGFERSVPQEVVRPLSIDERTLILATAVSIDFDYFSQHSHGSGMMPLGMMVPYPGGGGGGGAPAESPGGGKIPISALHSQVRNLCTVTCCPCLGQGSQEVLLAMK